MLEVQDLVVQRGTKEVLHGLSFTLSSGEVTGLIWNGCSSDWPVTLNCGRTLAAVPRNEFARTTNGKPSPTKSSAFISACWESRVLPRRSRRRSLGSRSSRSEKKIKSRRLRFVRE